MDFNYKVHRRPDGKIEIHTKFGHRIDNIRGKSSLLDTTADFTFTPRQIKRLMTRFANVNGKAIRLKMPSGKVAVFRPKNLPQQVHPEMFKRAT